MVGPQPFDVAVLDLGLPGMSGWDVALGLGRLQPGLPVVLVTGWGVTLDPARLRAAGVAEVLTKPVPPDRLLATCLHVAGDRAAAELADETIEESSGDDLDLASPAPC